MTSTHLFAFIAAFAVATLLTPPVLRLARRLGVVDVPREVRKIHKVPTPLLGGLAVFGTCALLVLLFFATGAFAEGVIAPKYLAGMLAGGLILMIGGFLDDRYNLPPAKQIVFPIAAAVMVVASGIGIRSISNPFGGTIPLDTWNVPIFAMGGVPYHLTLPADLFTVLWLLVLMYTTKFLDGLDGLVSGIAVIGALILLGLSLSPIVHQQDTALVAGVLAGAFGGFLLWNWHPAKIFLGEGGSLFAGYMLGILAIISGGKVATTLLVVGLPLADAAWVVFRRVFVEKRSPFSPGDRLHLHFRLLAAGFSVRQAVLLLWAFSLAFGISALFLKTTAKAVVFGILILLAAVLAGVRFREQRPAHGSSRV